MRVDPAETAAYIPLNTWTACTTLARQESSRRHAARSTGRRTDQQYFTREIYTSGCVYSGSQEYGDISTATPPGLTRAGKAPKNAFGFGNLDERAPRAYVRPCCGGGASINERLFFRSKHEIVNFESLRRNVKKPEPCLT